LHRRTISFRESFCTNMAVAMTMSAHSMSACFNFSMLRSTNRRSHDSGSSAETVNNPSGGNAQRFPSKGNACRKLQYVSGNSGLTSNTLTTFLLILTNIKDRKHGSVSVWGYAGEAESVGA